MRPARTTQTITAAELRRRLALGENILFSDYQTMLPECYECYMPGQPIPPSARVPPAPPP